MEYIVKKEEALTEIARVLINDAGMRKKWMFIGDLGSGKTTLIKYLCRELGVQELVTSPTFSLVNEYPAKDKMVYHLDLYRIKNVEEAIDIGIEEYLDSDCYCFIEWPEKIESLWPSDAVEINIQILNDSSRKILFL